MFTTLTRLLTLTISTALPTFLTYKALSLPPSQQTAQTLHPWLTYWIINGFLLSIPPLVPFDAYIRLGLHIYILIPGKAEDLYQGYVAPWLREHESQIEEGIATYHAKARALLGDLVGKAQDLVMGEGRREQLRREQEEEERRRRATEASAGGYVGSLLASWTSESRVQEVRHQGSGAEGQTLATRLGAMANAAAARGVESVQSAVDEAVRKSGGAASGSSGQASSDSSQAATSAAGPATSSSTGADLQKSKSETDFEKIEPSEAPDAVDKTSAQKSAGWGGWLWGSKAGSTTKAAKSE